MDFLERIFAWSPDGGSGATELLLLSVILFTLVAAVRPSSGRWRRGALKLRSHAKKTDAA